MSEIKLQADSGSGTTSIKGPSSTTGNAAREFLLPDVANGTLRTTTTSGAVLQVVQNYRTDLISTTSATFVDVLTQAITPSSTSNKILIFFQGMECTDAGDGNTYSRYKLMRDTTSIYNGDNSNTAVGASSGRYGRQSNYSSDPVQIMYMDSPSSTSSITYKVQYCSTRGGSFRVSIGGALRDDFEGNTRVPTNLILMEIAG
jgi:hypothetical protein